MKKRVKTSLILIIGVLLLIGIVVAKIILTRNSEVVLIGVQSIETLQEKTGCVNLSESLNEIAKCIGEKSTLYVQLGCHFCAQQEELFGESYQYLNVIDCYYEPQKCYSIKGTPTWVIKG